MMDLFVAIHQMCSESRCMLAAFFLDPWSRFCTTHQKQVSKSCWTFSSEDTIRCRQMDKAMTRDRNIARECTTMMMNR